MFSFKILDNEKDKNKKFKSLRRGKEIDITIEDIINSYKISENDLIGLVEDENKNIIHSIYTMKESETAFEELQDELEKAVFFYNAK